MRRRLVNKGLVFGIVAVLVFVIFVGIPMNVSAVESSGYNNPGNTLITDYGNDRVIEVDPSGKIVWQMTGLKDPHDAERLENGNTLIVEQNYGGPGNVMEVNSSGYIVWQYNISLNAPTDAERLSNGNTLIVDEVNDRVIEVAQNKSIVWKIDTGLNNPKDVERLDNGNTLIADLYANVVKEFAPNGTLIWQTPYWGGISLQDCERLDSGNTLITGAAGFNRVREIKPDFTIVRDIIAGTWIADAERLENGNTLIADGYGVNRVYEVDSNDTIVWEPTGLGLNWPMDVERLEFTNQPPTADAGPDQTVLVGENVIFNGTDSYDTDGIIESFDWDFGDDSPHGISSSPTHSYSEAGEYTVTLIVTDDGEATDIDTCLITVQTPDEAVEDIYDALDDIEVPEDAPPWVGNQYEKILDDLQDAQEELEADDIKGGLKELSQAVLRLVLIGDELDRTGEIIEQVIDLTDEVTSQRIQQAIDDADSRVDEIRVGLAQAAYETAQSLADEGYEYLAMVMYRIAFGFADRV